jgi:hypothetical protein
MPARPVLHSIIAAVLFMALVVASAASESNDKTDRLGVPGPIAFEGRDYALVSTSHPQADYFQQEYLPSGQSLDNYTHMFLIETLTANVTPKDAAASQIAMLDQRKGKDPLVNHEANVNEATGEVMLDFLVSGASNGKLVVEWNAYRFAPLKGNKPGVVLHGISRRAYGEEDAKKFLTGLKDWRSDAKNALTGFNAPAVNPQP